MRFHTLQALLAWEAPLPSLKQVGHVHETATCWPLTLSNVLMLRPCSAGFPRSSWNRPLMGRETWVPKRRPLVESGDENQCPPLPRECRSGAPQWFSTGRNQCQTRFPPMPQWPGPWWIGPQWQCHQCQSGSHHHPSPCIRIHSSHGSGRYPDPSRRGLLLWCPRLHKSRGPG